MLSILLFLLSSNLFCAGISDHDYVMHLLDIVNQARLRKEDITAPARSHPLQTEAELRTLQGKLFGETIVEGIMAAMPRDFLDRPDKDQISRYWHNEVKKAIQAYPKYERFIKKAAEENLSDSEPKPVVVPKTVPKTPRAVEPTHTSVKTPPAVSPSTNTPLQTTPSKPKERKFAYKQL